MLYVLENPLKNGKNLKETHFKKKIVDGYLKTLQKTTVLTDLVNPLV